MMTERDADTGQFTSEPAMMPNGYLGPTTPAYVPYDDGETEPDAMSLDDARDLIYSWDDEDLARKQNIEGDAVKIDLPENVTLTAEQGEKILTDTEAARKAEIEQNEAEGLRKAIDDVRAQDQQQEQPEPKLDEIAIKQAADKTAEAQRATTEAQEALVNGLAAATQIAEASFFSSFPEFQGIAPEQRMEAFARIQQSDPARALQIRSRIDEIGNHLQRYSAENEKLVSARQSKLQEYARTESAKFEESIKDTPKAERAAIEKAIVEAITNAGGSTEQFANLMRGSEFASATVQQMLWDYGKLLVDQSRVATVRTALPRPVRAVPTVMKPGSGSVKFSSELSVEAASRRLSQTASEADGWAFLEAKMRARG